MLSRALTLTFALITCEPLDEDEVDGGEEISKRPKKELVFDPMKSRDDETICSSKLKRTDSGFPLYEACDPTTYREKGDPQP